MSPIPDQSGPSGSVVVCPAPAPAAKSSSSSSTLPSSSCGTSVSISGSSCESESSQSTQTDELDTGIGSLGSGRRTQEEESWGWSGGEEDEVDHCNQQAPSIIQRLSGLFTQDRIDRATQTSKDPLTSETEKLAFDIVFFVLGRRSASSSVDDVTRCMRTSVQRMLDKHEPLFNGMVARLKLRRNTEISKGFTEMSNELFKQDEVSWSKIIALFAFAARLAQHCNDHDLGSLVFDVATNLSQFAVERLTPFLKRHGGWATLCDAFPLESDYEAKIWRSLVITGFGLTALATVLALQH